MKRTHTCSARQGLDLSDSRGTWRTHVGLLGRTTTNDRRIAPDTTDQDPPTMILPYNASRRPLHPNLCSIPTLESVSVPSNPFSPFVGPAQPGCFPRSIPLHHPRLDTSVQYSSHRRSADHHSSFTRSALQDLYPTFPDDTRERSLYPSTTTTPPPRSHLSVKQTVVRITPLPVPPAPGQAVSGHSLLPRSI